MESVVNSMGEALLVISQGTIKTANPAAEQLLGYQPGELPGKQLASIIAHGRDDERKAGRGRRRASAPS